MAFRGRRISLALIVVSLLAVPVCAQPPASDRWGVFSYHHIELYQAALEENRNARQSA